MIHARPAMLISGTPYHQREQPVELLYLLLPVALLLGGSYTNYYRTTTNLPEVTDCTGIDWWAAKHLLEPTSVR